jgi:hypothetical protein
MLMLGELGCQSHCEEQEIHRARNDQIWRVLHDQDIEESRNRLSRDDPRVPTYSVRARERGREHRL